LKTIRVNLRGERFWIILHKAFYGLVDVLLLGLLALYLPTDGLMGRPVCNLTLLAAVWKERGKHKRTTLD